MRSVIAEDQVLLRDGLVRLLEEAGHVVVAQVGNARALIDQVNAQRPDLIVSDIRMPPAHTDDGARAVTFLRDRYPELATVVLSQVVDPAQAAFLSNGRAAAFGYLLKDRVLDLDEFLAALQVVGDGGTVIDPVVIDSILRQDRGRLGQLTERELDVLREVASGRSNAGIARELVISPRTVDAHLRSIFTKLGIAASADANVRVLAVLSWLSDPETEIVQRRSGPR